MTFGFYSRRGVYTSAWAKEQIRKMKALNIEYVALIATVFHETDYSPREFLDITESPGELETDPDDRFHSCGRAEGHAAPDAGKS